MYWHCFCLFKMGFNHLMYKDSFIFNRCMVLVASKTEKKSLKHLSKQSLDDIRCSYMWDILAKVFIFSGCQLCTILTDISGNKASTKIRIDKLGKMFTLIWIICWKTAHRSFSFVKNNLTFRLLKLVNFLLR